MSFSPRLPGLLLLLATSLALPVEAPAAAVPAPSSAPSWAWPVLAPPPLDRPPLARPYRAPPTAYGAGHRGIDLDVAAGTPVLSPDDGIVHFAGAVGTRPVLSIEHEGGLLSSLEPVTTRLSPGAVVRRGETVGAVAPSAGHCPADCLHVGARLDGRYLSPLVLLGGVPRAVLLPLGSSS